eukprot:12047957-Karenia_brevis.AAC.1
MSGPKKKSGQAKNGTTKNGKKPFKRTGTLSNGGTQKEKEEKEIVNGRMGTTKDGRRAKAEEKDVAKE